MYDREVAEEASDVIPTVLVEQESSKADIGLRQLKSILQDRGMKLIDASNEDAIVESIAHQMDAVSQFRNKRV